MSDLLLLWVGKELLGQPSRFRSFWLSPLFKTRDASGEAPYAHGTGDRLSKWNSSQREAQQPLPCRARAEGAAAAYPNAATV
jgi:hypothetical protein